MNPFVSNWLVATSNKVISMMYLTYGYLSGLLGFSLSFVTRLEMNSPLPYVISYSKSQLFNSVTTLHGIIMIFLFIMPVLIGGVGNRELPELSGLSDFVFPRMNTGSFWVSVAAVVFIVDSINREESLGTG
jgi:heme/copper-type cytochrome/quinol oxidase subunit 1